MGNGDYFLIKCGRKANKLPFSLTVIVHKPAKGNKDQAHQQEIAGCQILCIAAPSPACWACLNMQLWGPPSTPVPGRGIWQIILPLSSTEGRLFPAH